MSIEAPPRQSRIASLDLIRGLAALEVFVGHLRSFVVVPHTASHAPGWIALAVYGATKFAHQAVIVFFVLSGYFIAGSIVEQTKSGRWSWYSYTANRLSRLWVVLIPALLITLALDKVGMSLTGGVGYDGRWFHLFNSGPALDHPITHSWIVLLANIAFLQTITAPVFGSDSPLWSLSNEFWYYVLFPLLWIGLRKRPVLLAAGVVIAFLLPHGILVYGLIWLVGLGSWYAARSRHFDFLKLRPAVPVSIVLLLGALGTAGIPRMSAASDFLIGIASAVVVAVAARQNLRPGALHDLACWSGDMSYSVYVMHFPILAFCAFVFLRGKTFELGLTAFGVSAAFAAATIALCVLFWWCLERNTTRVRKLIFGRGAIRPANPAQFATSALR